MSGGKHTEDYSPGGHSSLGRLEAVLKLLYIALAGMIVLALWSLYLGYQGHENNSRTSKLVAENDKDQSCLLALQQFQADRATALTKITADDRAAVSAWIARVSKDVVLGTRESFLDIPKAYEAYRRQVADNDKLRASYGSGIEILSACAYVVKPTSPSSPPTLKVPTPRRTSLPPLPTTTFTVTNSNGSVSTITLGVTSTVRATSFETQRVVSTRVVAEGTRTLTVLRTMTATATATATRTVRPPPVPVPVSVPPKTVTATATVTKSCVPLLGCTHK